MLLILHIEQLILVPGISRMHAHQNYCHLTLDRHMVVAKPEGRVASLQIQYYMVKRQKGISTMANIVSSQGRPSPRDKPHDGVEIEASTWGRFSTICLRTIGRGATR